MATGSDLEGVPLGVRMGNRKLRNIRPSGAFWTEVTSSSVTRRASPGSHVIGSTLGCSLGRLRPITFYELALSLVIFPPFSYNIIYFNNGFHLRCFRICCVVLQVVYHNGGGGGGGGGEGGGGGGGGGGAGGWRRRRRRRKSLWVYLWLTQKSSIFSISFHYSTSLFSIFSISFHFSTYFSSIFSKSFHISSIFSISFHNFLLYFPNLSTIQLIFLS